MTTDSTAGFDSVKQAFAPMADALKNLQTMEMPESARELFKKATSTAKERVNDAFAGSEKVTAAIETAVAGGVSEATKLGRTLHQTMQEDTEAFFEGLDKLASAKTFSEAVQIQSELARERGEALISRTKSGTEYLGKLVAEGTKTLQDNFAKATNKSV